MNKRTIKDTNQKDIKAVLYNLFLSYENMSDRNEKLASAIFLLSDHIKDNEPVKTSLRQNATELITCYPKYMPVKKTIVGQNDFDSSFEYSYTLHSDKAHRFHDVLFQHLTALISLVTVGQRAGMISPSNAHIMNENLKSTLNELQLVYAQTVAPVSFESLMGADFISVPHPTSSRSLVVSRPVSVSRTFATRQIASGKKMVTSTSGQVRTGSIKTNQVPSSVGTTEGQQGISISHLTNQGSEGGIGSATAGQSNAVYVTKDEKVRARQQKILDFVKGHPASTISDIISTVTDYSEKTVQRELINLIGQNLLRREGERRWSRYSAA